MSVVAKYTFGIRCELVINNGMLFDVCPNHPLIYPPDTIGGNSFYRGCVCCVRSTSVALPKAKVCEWIGFQLVK